MALVRGGMSFSWDLRGVVEPGFWCSDLLQGLRFPRCLLLRCCRADRCLFFEGVVRS